VDPTQLSLLDLAERRLAWLDQRQAVLAQNLANASTPGWVPTDLPSFAASLAAQTGGTGLARTHPGHLAGTADDILTGVTPQPSARAPDGNAVALDQQLAQVADTQTAQELVTSIYKAYLGMFNTALDHGAS
jgi:flagellar basal-body rod protein FlgB